MIGAMWLLKKSHESSRGLPSLLRFRSLGRSKGSKVDTLIVLNLLWFGYDMIPPCQRVMSPA